MPNHLVSMAENEAAQRSLRPKLGPEAKPAGPLMSQRQQGAPSAFGARQALRDSGYIPASEMPFRKPMSGKEYVNRRLKLMKAMGMSGSTQITPAMMQTFIGDYRKYRQVEYDRQQDDMKAWRDDTWRVREFEAERTLNWARENRLEERLGMDRTAAGQPKPFITGSTNDARSRYMGGDIPYEELQRIMQAGNSASGRGGGDGSGLTTKELLDFAKLTNERRSPYANLAPDIEQRLMNRVRMTGPPSGSAPGPAFSPAGVGAATTPTSIPRNRMRGTLDAPPKWLDRKLDQPGARRRLAAPSPQLDRGQAKGRKQATVQMRYQGTGEAFTVPAGKAQAFKAKGYVVSKSR